MDFRYPQAAHDRIRIAVKDVVGSWIGSLVWDRVQNAYCGVVQAGGIIKHGSIHIDERYVMHCYFTEEPVVAGETIAYDFIDQQIREWAQRVGQRTTRLRDYGLIFEWLANLEAYPDKPLKVQPDTLEDYERLDAELARLASHLS